MNAGKVLTVLVSLMVLAVMVCCDGGTGPSDNAPTNPNPANGATEVDINQDLSWSCSDPDGGPLTYYICFGTSSDPPLVESGYNSTGYDPGAMDYGTKYYWEIHAEDARGNRTTGPVWHFTTESEPGPFLWNADWITEKIYKINPDTGAVVSSFNAPGSWPTGLTLVGTYLWNADWGEGKIYQINPNTGAVVRSFDSPGVLPIGLAWDGACLWNVDRERDEINKIDPKTGLVINSFNSPGPSPDGLVWDGTYLWNSDWGTEEIYKIDPDTGTVVEFFDSPEVWPAGLAWDGGYLWNADSWNGRIYRVDPDTGAVITSFDSPGSYPTGLTWQP
ncbi:MAG: hypothetical protein JSW52_11830 [Candidatus Coatesbacteria bacterium]|nr:MAG: hypothetical protein JSW52_11830 [Candidatus Coatesbacteria bacterium]